MLKTSFISLFAFLKIAYAVNPIEHLEVIISEPEDGVRNLTIKGITPTAEEFSLVNNQSLKWDGQWAVEDCFPFIDIQTDSAAFQFSLLDNTLAKCIGIKKLTLKTPQEIIIVNEDPIYLEQAIFAAPNLTNNRAIQCKNLTVLSPIKDKSTLINNGQFAVLESFFWNSGVHNLYNHGQMSVGTIKALNGINEKPLYITNKVTSTSLYPIACLFFCDPTTTKLNIAQLDNTGFIGIASQNIKISGAPYNIKSPLDKNKCTGIFCLPTAGINSIELQQIGISIGHKNLLELTPPWDENYNAIKATFFADEDEQPAEDIIPAAPQEEGSDGVTTLAGDLMMLETDASQGDHALLSFLHWAVEKKENPILDVPEKIKNRLHDILDQKPEYASLVCTLLEEGITLALAKKVKEDILFDADATISDGDYNAYLAS